MTASTVRIEKIEIENFKNVKKGILDLSKRGKQKQTASITGIYGQNGSGKTALIDSLAILNFVLSGGKLPGNVIDYIQEGESCFTLAFTFSIDAADQSYSYQVEYRFSVRKEVDFSEAPVSSGELHVKAVLFNERLSCSYQDANTKTRFLPIVDTETDKIFTPASKYKVLMGSDKETVTDLLVAKKLATESSRSFIFSKQFVETVQKNCNQSYLKELFPRLIVFGMRELFVLHTLEAGMIPLNGLPLFFRYTDADKISAGGMPLSLSGPTLLPVEAYDLVKQVIANQNIVLSQLIPGLKINIQEFGRELSDKGDTRVRIELTSCRNGKDIPLRYESDGIKKIISVLQLLIVTYNRKDITVAIDELDSGIFEYLLGELLRILSEHGKGQLIFTSHNLRPLETLSPYNIVFTTTNPSNRYVHLPNIKTNNNLRDTYYRDIMLGPDSKDSLYERTNNNEIALAFREAGGNVEN